MVIPWVGEWCGATNHTMLTLIVFVITLFLYFILKYELPFLNFKGLSWVAGSKLISGESASFLLTENTIHFTQQIFLIPVSSIFLSTGSFLATFKQKHLPIEKQMKESPFNLCVAAHTTLFLSFS